MGYYRAGFTEIVGVDIKPQPRYPFEFVQADALEYVTMHGREFDAIHASPPCQAYSLNLRGLVSSSRYPRLIEITLGRLQGHIFVMENVIGAPLPHNATLFGEWGIMLCGTMFELRNVQRHRLFQTSFPVPLPRACLHRVPAMNPYDADARRRDGIEKEAMKAYGKAMGIDWMIGAEVSEAIPPAYTEYIGRHLIAALQQNRT